MSQQNIDIPHTPSSGTPDTTDLIIILKGGGDSVVGSYASAVAMPDRNETQRIAKIAALQNAVKVYPVSALDNATQDSEIQELARDAVATALRGGANVSVSSDDTANTITITVTDNDIKDAVGAMFGALYSSTTRTVTIPPSRTLEQLQDAIGGMFDYTGDNGVASYDDAAGTISITPGGFSPKFVRFPITHNTSPARNVWTSVPATLQIDAATTPYSATASTGVTRETNGLAARVATTGYYSVNVKFYLFGEY